MTATSYERGYLIRYDEKNYRWVYADNGSVADDSRPCPRCGKFPTRKGYDACLGKLPGIKAARCGHGTEKSYQQK